MAAYDFTVAQETWDRYCYLRDMGHLDYIAKAKKCEDFFAGMQWSQEDMAKLRASRRPALTINKILSTVANVLGDQIFNRTEIAFRPKRGGASSEIADTLTKVFSHIGDQNQLEWVRSDVYADGLITSRGWYDVRLDFTDSLKGEVRITQLNPKNVLPDADAEDYDPDTWGDVMISKWMSPQQISMLYGAKYGEMLKHVGASYFSTWGADGMEGDRDRFGPARLTGWYPGYNEGNAALERSIRVLERQYRMLDTKRHFVDVKTGDMRQVPDTWGREEIAYVLQKYNLGIVRKQVERIKWCVVAGDTVLHEDWSPYKHFTPVPYFPYFRRGHTIGVVENLLGPQEYLNKVSSQELHVVNTTANSGWKFKSGSLVGMTRQELEERGAETGLVLEVTDMDALDKIPPNQTPTGLDRISYKAEEHIKSISGVSDYRTGNAREDVSAKAVRANQQGSSANQAKFLDNLRRTDYLLARNVLDIVQEYYAEERLMFITKDRFSGEQEELIVNQVTPEGEIANDLTIGEYAVVVTNEPERDTFEDSQFEQALMLRKEVGVPIPDEVLIQASRLRNKSEVVKAISEAANSPDAQAAKALQARGQAAEVAKTEAEAKAKEADAIHKIQKAKFEGSDMGDPQAEFDLEKYKVDEEMKLEKYKADMKLALERELGLAKIQVEREAAMMQRAQAVHASTR